MLDGRTARDATHLAWVYFEAEKACGDGDNMLCSAAAAAQPLLATFEE